MEFHDTRDLLKEKTLDPAPCSRHREAKKQQDGRHWLGHVPF
jgi:hypothetical protein